MYARNSNIDAAKGLGIALVVLGHNYLVLEDRGLLFRAIFAFHMPLFFFISGIFLNERDAMKMVIAKKAACLLKSYFVVLTLLGMAKYLAGRFKGEPFDAATYFLGVVWSSGSMLTWPPLWFLTCLFLATIASMCVIKLAGRTQRPDVVIAIIACLSLAAGIASIRAFWRPAEFTLSSLAAGNYPGLPWSLDLLPLVCAFMLFGYAFRERVKWPVVSVPMLALVACAFVGLQLTFKQTMDLNLRIYGDPLITSVQAMLGIYLALGLAALLQRWRALHALLSYLGSASLFILIFHFYIGGAVYVRISAYAPQWTSVAGVASFLLALLLPALAWELVKRQKYMAFFLLPPRRQSLPSQ